MAIANLFSNNLRSSAKQISQDSKIYEAFKPYLSDILGIDLETYMKDKKLRSAYQQKYALIKTKFQEEKGATPIKDEECLTRIAIYSSDWQEFVATAKEHTLDGGESFIRNTPLDKFILMSRREKEALEQSLIDSAIEKIRVLTENQADLNIMLVEHDNIPSEQDSRKLQ